MAAESDAFVIATYALWAGDLCYAAQLLEQYSPPHRTAPITREGIESPEAIIKATGALRLRQLRQKRGEFDWIARDQPQTDIKLTDTPTILTTKYLRACLWRRDEREFVMRGYLTDLRWERKLLSLAQTAASRERLARPDVGQNEQYLQSVEAGLPLGGSWAVEGKLFIRVNVNDLAQIKAIGLWPHISLPAQASDVTRSFSAILDYLDSPDRSDLEHNVVE